MNNSFMNNEELFFCFHPSGLPPPALQALCKLITASEAGEQLINRVGPCTFEQMLLDFGFLDKILFTIVIII